MASTAVIHLLTHEFPPYKGGAATVCRELATAAVQLPCSVTVWAPDYPSGKYSREPYRVNPLPVVGKVDLLDQWRLVRALHTHIRPTFQPQDILHLAEPGPVAAAIHFPRAFRFAQNRIVITLHGSEILRHTRYPWQRQLFRKLLKSAQVVHVLSRHNAELLTRLIPEAEGRIRIVPGGPRTFPRRTPHFPFPMGSEDFFEVLSVGRLHPRKGQMHLIEALARIPEKSRRRLRVWMVGPIRKWPYFRQCFRRARQNNLNLHFVHGCPDSMLPAFYEAADLCVMTSIAQPGSIEGFGLANLEAASFGVPVVAHDSGGIRETLIDGETGILIPPGQPELLRVALLKLMNDPAQLKCLGQGARTFAAQFSWRDTARSLYEPLIK